MNMVLNWKRQSANWYKFSSDYPNQQWWKLCAEYVGNAGKDRFIESLWLFKIGTKTYGPHFPKNVVNICEELRKYEPHSMRKLTNLYSTRKSELCEKKQKLTQKWGLLIEDEDPKQYSSNKWIIYLISSVAWKPCDERMVTVPMYSGKCGKDKFSWQEHSDIDFLQVWIYNF